MIGRGLLALTIVSSCVLSLPLTPSQLENEDVKVMKCIVEALADVLSRPHPTPVSQECLVTLKTDDRLVSILRHHNFLRELQEIAVQGGQQRAQLQEDDATADPTTQTAQTAADVADRSMLEALGGPGERSILAQKRRTGNGDESKEKDNSLGDEESQEDRDTDEEVQVKSEDDESPGSHISESEDEWSEEKAAKREEEEEEYEEKRENSEEENVTKEKKGAESGEKRDVPRSRSKQKKFDGEDEEGKNKRSAFFSHKQENKSEQEEDDEEEEEVKRGKPWAKRGKALSLKKKAKDTQELSSQTEVPHHSKEFTEEEEEEEKKKRDLLRSPEEKELQMIAKRGPEDRRGLEEEGSASRKSEEPEIESLAAIESELENVAQKIHELRRG